MHTLVLVALALLLVVPWAIDQERERVAREERRRRERVLWPSLIEKDR